MHAPVLCLQVYSQCKKLCEEESAQFEPNEEDDATTEVSTNFDRTQAGRRKTKCNFWKNFKALWSYNP